MAVYEQFLTVSYLDIGENNKLTLKGLIRMLQEVACIHSDKVGYGPNDSEQNHLAWLILNWKIEMYAKPAWNTRIKIRTWPRSFDKLQSCRDFEVFDEKDKLIARASSKWIMFNSQLHKIARITPEVMAAYSCDTRTALGESPFDEKMKIENIEGEPVYTYTIQKRDIDTNHHVNNLYYLDYAYEALPDEIFENMKFETLEIMYKKEIKYRDTIACFYQLIDGKHSVIITDENKTKIHAVIRFN